MWTCRPLPLGSMPYWSSSPWCRGNSGPTWTQCPFQWPLPCVTGSLFRLFADVEQFLNWVPLPLKTALGIRRIVLLAKSSKSFCPSFHSSFSLQPDVVSWPERCCYCRLWVQVQPVAKHPGASVWGVRVSCEDRSVFRKNLGRRDAPCARRSLSSSIHSI